jgi:transketolase
MEKLKTEEYHSSMRGYFAGELYNHMVDNKDIWVVTADLGYGLFDKIRDSFSDRFINCGAAEQVMIGIGVGLAEMGKIPFCYSITPFLLYRPFETINLYLHGEGANVKLIGSGRNNDYGDDGFSHWGWEDKKIMRIFERINAMWPETKEEIPELVEKMVTTKQPFYCNLKR